MDHRLDEEGAMSSNPCTYCRKPQTDAASLCHLCTSEASRLLRGVRALADELRVTVTKLDKTAIFAGPRSQTFARPLPINLPAAEILWRLGSTVVTWERSIRLLPEISKGQIVVFATDQNGSADFLVAHLPAIRKHEFAGQLLVDLKKATSDALRAIDLPETKVFLGPCETPGLVETCHAAVYAKIGASWARCSCGASHDVAERREWLLSSMEELTVTASTARKLALYLGISIPAATISDWKRKEWIAEVEPDVYRFGDILAVKRRDLAKVPSPRTGPPTGSIPISA
jgi:hypothetical protein